MENTDFTYTNHLINESSPYLLQHAHNPVNWYPWGEEALEKAKRENKLLLISIGYAACHWCHVMEEESFEDEKVAEYMNDNFVAIKVDREERPDIDRIYMDAVQLITGQGGWPLNCIALPDGRPVYGGTYFPKENWLLMLSQVVSFVKENPEKAEEQATALTKGVRSGEIIRDNQSDPLYSIEDLNRIFSLWEKGIDGVNGGQEGAPKFPMPAGHKYLLHYNHLSGNQKAVETVTNSLIQMAYGGIYDQIGGGFSRYSTDIFWKVPHFEKMLYDNAQLVSLYSLAFRKTKNPLFKKVVEETLSFVRREMGSESGGLYSSLDADSEGEEGKFYLWTYDEMTDILGADSKEILDYYNVSVSGNWEKGRNILFKSGIYDEPDNLEKIKDLLFNEREKRVRPGLDNKILTSWNALMITAYVDAYRSFDKDEYLQAALKGAEFILFNMKDGLNRLKRNYKDGQSSINAFLDDYAFTIEAFISLYQATFDEKWLNRAKALTDYVEIHFSDNENGLFFYTSDLDPALIARKTEIIDNVIPSSNSQMAKNLYILGHYFSNEEYIGRSQRMVNNVIENAKRGGVYFANWDILLAWFISEPYEVAIVGDNFEAVRRALDKNYLPGVFLSGGKREGDLPLLKYKLVEGETTIYVCRNRVCQNPVVTIEEALEQIN